jgi:hypothetical protein
LGDGQAGQTTEVAKMIDFQPDYNACEDNEWHDLIQKYWNIEKSSKGEIKQSALLSLRDEITARLIKLPPDYDEIQPKHPTMPILDE